MQAYHKTNLLKILRTSTCITAATLRWTVSLYLQSYSVIIKNPMIHCTRLYMYNCKMVKKNLLYTGHANIHSENILSLLGENLLLVWELCFYGFTFLIKVRRVSICTYISFKHFNVCLPYFLGWKGVHFKNKKHNWMFSFNSEGGLLSFSEILLHLSL